MIMSWLKLILIFFLTSCNTCIDIFEMIKENLRHVCFIIVLSSYVRVCVVGER